jgi:Tol biopolymer transport system component
MRSRSLVLSLAVGVFGVAGLAATPSWATFPGTNGRIAFAARDNRDVPSIWTMQADGSGLTNITSAPGAPRFDLEPDWSPDGTKIAFRSGSAGAGEIYTMNANGTGFTQLTSNSAKDWVPAWSPDGTKIAFASNRNDPDPANCAGFSGCNNDIFVMPSSGGLAVQATFDSGSDLFPQFSPDGSEIAYDSDASGSLAIYTVDLNTLAVTKLTADSLQAGEPDYSPDGTKIAFASNPYFCASNATKGCKSDIFVMNANGSLITRLTQKFGNNIDPTWSPAGDKLVFNHGSTVGKPEQIYEISPDGTGLTRITRTNRDSFGPDWGSG